MEEQNLNSNDDYYSIVLDKIINDKNFLEQISSKNDLDAMYEYSINIVGNYPKETFLKIVAELKNIPISEESLENVNGGNIGGRIFLNIKKFLENGGNSLIKLLSKF